MQLPMGNKAFADPLGLNKDQDIHDPTVEEFARMSAALYNLDKAFLDCFSTPAGQAVLEFWKTQTINAATWMSSLATGPGGLDAATAHGFAREGQNALVRDAINRMTTVATATSPEDYINKVQLKGNQNGRS